MFYSLIQRPARLAPDERFVAGGPGGLVHILHEPVEQDGPVVGEHWLVWVQSRGVCEAGVCFYFRHYKYTHVYCNRMPLNYYSPLPGLIFQPSFLASQRTGRGQAPPWNTPSATKGRAITFRTPITLPSPLGAVCTPPRRALVVPRPPCLRNRATS